MTLFTGHFTALYQMWSLYSVQPKCNVITNDKQQAINDKGGLILRWQPSTQVKELRKTTTN
jgi:hypothetical protein